MFRKVLMLTAIVLVFSSFEIQAAVVDSNWVGGEEGLWSEANNWDPAIVPDNNGPNTFAVRIDGGTAGVEVRLQQNRTINRLDTYGEVGLERRVREEDLVLALEEDLDLTLRVLESNNGLTNHGFLDIEDVIISGDVLNASGAYLEGGEVDITDGNLLNESGARINCSEHYLDVHNGSIYSYGSIVSGPAGGPWAEYELQNFDVIEIYGGLCSSDQALTNESTGVIKGFGTLFSEEMIQNKGKIHAYGGSLAVGIEGALINTGILANMPPSLLHIKPAEDLNNQGTIQVFPGGGIGIDCNLVNEPSAVIELLGGTLAAPNITQKAGATFEGFGTIAVADEILIESGAKIELTGPTNIVGDVNIPASATLEISDGQTLITGHTTCDGTIHLIGGTVIFQGGCDCDDCNIINEAGIDRNHFDINADGIENFEDFAYFANTWLWKASWY